MKKIIGMSLLAALLSSSTACMANAIFQWYLPPDTPPTISQAATVNLSNTAANMVAAATQANITIIFVIFYLQQATFLNQINIGYSYNSIVTVDILEKLLSSAMPIGAKFSVQGNIIKAQYPNGTYTFALDSGSRQIVVSFNMPLSTTGFESQSGSR